MRQGCVNVLRQDNNMSRSRPAWSYDAATLWTRLTLKVEAN